MSDSAQPTGSTSPNDERAKDAAASENSRRRPTLAPMGSSVTAAPMRTRPPMTALPPLAPKPPPPPEPVAAPVKKKGSRFRRGMIVFAVLAAAAAGAYYKFMLSP
jgi:hypothetical protein